MYAPHNKVDNLIATIDYNGQQIDGPVDKILSLLSLRDKWESFGWIVQEFDGNKIETVVEGLEKAKSLASVAYQTGEIWPFDRKKRSSPFPSMLKDGLCLRI